MCVGCGGWAEFFLFYFVVVDSDSFFVCFRGRLGVDTAMSKGVPYFGGGARSKLENSRLFSLQKTTSKKIGYL